MATFHNQHLTRLEIDTATVEFPGVDSRSHPVLRTTIALITIPFVPETSTLTKVPSRLMMTLRYRHCARNAWVERINLTARGRLADRTSECLTRSRPYTGVRIISSPGNPGFDSPGPTIGPWRLDERWQELSMFWQVFSLSSRIL